MPVYHSEIARLKQKGITSNRKIATLLGISRNTVNAVVRQILESDLSFKKVSCMTDEEIIQRFRKKKDKTLPDYFIPDYESLARELSKPGMTMQILWEEYGDSCRLMGKRGYQHTQFREHFNEYLSHSEFRDIMKHKAGEQIEVDWTGERPHWTDPDTGEIVYGYLFGGILPFSGLAYARITTDMKMENWIDCHNKMYEYFGGSTQILTPDNLKTGITKHTRDELVVNPTCQNLADHYNTVIISTRVRTPRDKNQVENLMCRFEQTIIARLRNCQFFSIEEYNEAAAKEVERFNNKPFQKKEGTRRELFEKYEKDTLIPLPAEPYEMARWKKAKVQSNSHIAYGKNYYSVPYKYIGKEVDVKITAKEISIYFNQQLLCSHKLLIGRIGGYSTDLHHMSPNSNAYGEWNSTRYLNWAKTKGQYVYEVVYRLFESVNVEQRCYRSVHSILKLADTYTNQRLDQACQYLLGIITKPTYRDIKHVLETDEDLKNENKEKSKEPSSFVRGGDYFG